MEKLGYAILLVVAVYWFVQFVRGMIAGFPYDWAAVAVVVAIGLLLVKVVRDRLASKEDDYYSKNVDQ